ncbi:MAG: DUF6090 family protein [Saprospiraceae bacterium]
MIRKLSKLNWKYALGEITLIFIGITLAIMFQNWNDNQKKNKLEKAALQELKVALQNDLKDVNANINTHDKGVTACQSLLTILNSDEPANAMQLLGKMYQAVDFTFLVSDVSTYEYLKSVGLHLIKNDELRRQISKLYDVAYESIYGVEKNYKEIQLDLVKNVKQYYTADNKQFYLIKNKNEIKQNHQIKFDIKNMEFAHNNMKNKYEQKIKPELEKLIELVNKEIE